MIDPEPLWLTAKLALITTVILLIYLFRLHTGLPTQEPKAKQSLKQL